MAADVKPRTWDFSEALKLLNTFTYPPPASKSITTSSAPQGSSLGDFGKLYGLRDADPLAYTSDGAAPVQDLQKRVKWDEIIESSSTTSDDEDQAAATQRQVTFGGALEAVSLPGGLLDSVGPEFAKYLVDFLLTLPSRTHPKPQPPESLLTPKSSKKSRQSKRHRDRAKRRDARQAASELESEAELGQHARNTPAVKASVRRSARIAAQAARTTGAPAQSSALQKSLQETYQVKLPAHVTQPWQFSIAIQRSPIQPPTPPVPGISTLTPHSHAALIPTSSSLRSQDKADRDFQLRLRLIHQFPEDKQWLMAAVPLANHFHMAQSTGIHVFVDYSNISIGFMTRVFHLRHLAQRRGEVLRMSHQLSFDSLVLLLERGRPVAKRVLAGSTSEDPAIAKAAAIGYDVKMLQKVFKDESLMERDRRTAARLSTPQAQLGLDPGYADSHGSNATDSLTPPTTSALSYFALGQPPVTPPSSSSAARQTSNHTITTPTTSTGRWVEQGVDEILHMNIYESVIDAETPSTIVLATGDGAQAEFSDGFIATVERALNRGWKVELVSWRKPMNYLWRDETWVRKWGGRFRILELDGWEEFLEEVKA